MKYRKIKHTILSENPELELNSDGDFTIKKELVSNYEIIDFHCHTYNGLFQMFPRFLQKEKNGYGKSLMNLSCFPYSMHLFDIDEVSFTRFPAKLLSIDGVKTRIKLLTGALVLNYVTTERLLMDMNSNGISKAVIMQINPPNKSCAQTMDNVVIENEQLYTFGSIHPFDSDIDGKISSYMKLSIKGWKLNPHVCGFAIDSKESLALIGKLSKTGLPILCCSGIGSPKEALSSKIWSKQTKKDMLNQELKKYEIVLESFPNTTFILAHSGCYEFETMIDILYKFNNVYTDISIQPACNIRRLLNEVGSERVLFGTDYPFVTQAFSILSVLRATLSEEERRNIFSLNAKKLLGQ